MRYLFALIAAVLWSGAALGQHAHGDQKGPNGGAMDDIADVHAELLTSDNTITINIFDEDGKPLSTKGYTGSVLVVIGSNRETVSLIPLGASALKGEAKSPVAASANITLLIKTDVGKIGQARFKK